MSIEALKSQLAAEVANPHSATHSAVVIWVDSQCKNALVAARECGVFQGHTYDKFRVRAWYIKRDGTWARGNDTLACQWVDGNDLLDALSIVSVQGDDLVVNGGPV